MSNPAIAQYHWHADWGMTLGRTFLWQDDEGADIDATSMTGVLTVRLAYSTDPVLTADATTADGSIAITVPAADMEFGSEVTEQDYVYDIVLDDSGTLIKFLEGTFTMHPTVSR